MSDYDDGWERDKDGFWTKDGQQVAPWEVPESQYPVDYSADHDQDRDNFFEHDKKEMPPVVEKIIAVTSAVFIVLICGALLLFGIKLLSWAWSLL